MLIESEDYLQDIAFDYCSNKMAVCSSDRRIQIYKRKNMNNDKTKGEYFNYNGKGNDIINSKEDNNFTNWEFDTSWEAHDAPVTKVIFSSPEYGSLLASSGYDKRVIIWQEKIEGGKSIWILKHRIQEFSDNVEDISFCPRVYGLKLAVCTFNGKIKIFEPKDYVFYVNWNCVAQKDISLACSTIYWNPSSLDPQSFVLGCYSQLSSTGMGIKDVKEKDHDSQINSSIKNNLLQIYVYCESKKDFICQATLVSDELKSHSDSITYTEWAPQFGRSYHMIASCSLDKKIIIWKFNLDFDFINDQFQNIKICPTTIRQILYVETPNPIHRVSFNINGTVLSSNDSNGVIKIFKKEDGEYKEIYEFKSNIKTNSEY